MSYLAEKINAELDNIKEIVTELASIDISKPITSIELAGIAAYLHSFYNGVENILKQIFIYYSWKLPQGNSWHRDFLNEAVKHKILSEKLKNELVKYLGFRHYFIHNYGFKLNVNELKPLLIEVPKVLRKFKSEIKVWIA